MIKKYEECVQGGRPELFPKHDPESVVGPGYPIVRPIDTQRLVPEAELVSVYGRATAGKIVLLRVHGGERRHRQRDGSDEPAQSSAGKELERWVW